MISIHAPRVGGDHLRGALCMAQEHFNPRPPCGGRPEYSRKLTLLRNFNPRPPCGGRRIPQGPERWKSPYFNPRPPCGGRHLLKVHLLDMALFQSTPPVWGATPEEEVRVKGKLFQSTPPVWGATGPSTWTSRTGGYFNPRPPCGGRQRKQLKIQAVRAKNRQFLQISSPNSYPILKNKVASLQIILQNLVRDLGDFLRVYVSHLKHQYIFWVVGCLYSKMLDLVFIAVSQVIKTKTVLFRVHDLTQLCL